jgi:hypothetical protein
MFGRPSLLKTTADWFRQLATVVTGPRTVTGAGHALAGNFTVSGELSVRHRAGAGSSVERRLEVLEANFDRLQDETEGKFREVRKDFSSVREAMEAESAARSAADARTSTTLENLAVGGLHLEGVGLVWLFLGMLGTSIPDEIAWVLRWLGWTS